MAMNVVIIFSDGSREQLNGVDDKYRDDVNGLVAIAKKKFPNKKIVDIKYPKLGEAPAPIPGTPPAVSPNEANIGHYGDKNRWRNLGGGYWHNVDTHEIQLR